MGRTYSAIQMLIILYLLKCLDIKKLYFWVQIGRQNLTCIPDPKKKQYKKRFFFLPTSIDAHMGREGGEGRKKNPLSQIFALLLNKNAIKHLKFSQPIHTLPPKICPKPH
jgi:hypothetical protein